MAELFHYHWWTNDVEQMEQFYEQLGFEVFLRAAKVDGEMKKFNPPLTWDDFRNEEIKFRTIEMRNGRTNITFGNGKKNIFDHIGFLVNLDEYQSLIRNARSLKWTIDEGEKRTFVMTPWKFRIELQTNSDYVMEDMTMSINNMTLKLPFGPHPEILGDFLDLKKKIISDDKIVLTNGTWDLTIINDSQLFLESIHFDTNENSNSTMYTDPVGTRLFL